MSKLAEDVGRKARLEHFRADVLRVAATNNVTYNEMLLAYSLWMHGAVDKLNEWVEAGSFVIELNQENKHAPRR